MSFIALFIFITYLWIYIVIIPPLCVLVRQSRVALVDYVSPLWGLNSHVSPRGAWPENHNPHVRIPSFSILLRCKYYIVIFSPFFLCDLGVIIPIGRGGLCETSIRLYPPCNPIRVGPMKILYFKPHYFRHLWCHCDYCPFSPLLIWAWKHRTVLAVLGKSFK